MWLGLVLCGRIGKAPDAYTDQVAEAVDQLTVATRLPDDGTDPFRSIVHLNLGVALTAQHRYLAGDRQPAVAAFEGVLRTPDLDPAMDDVAHVGLTLLGAESPPSDVDDLVVAVARYDLEHPLRGLTRTMFGPQEHPPELDEVGLSLLEQALRLIPARHPAREPTLRTLAMSFGRALASRPEATGAIYALLTSQQNSELVDTYLLAVVELGAGLADQNADLISSGIRGIRTVTEQAPEGHWTRRVDGAMSTLMFLRWLAGAELDDPIFTIDLDDEPGTAWVNSWLVEFHAQIEPPRRK